VSDILANLLASNFFLFNPIALAKTATICAGTSFFLNYVFEIPYYAIEFFL